MAFQIIASLFTIVTGYFLYRGIRLSSDMKSWAEEMEELKEEVEGVLEQLSEERDSEVKPVLKGSALRSAQREAKLRPGTPFKVSGTNVAVVASPALKGSALNKREPKSW